VCGSVCSVLTRENEARRVRVRSMRVACETAARRVRVVCVCVWRAGLWERGTQGACEEHACGMRQAKKQHAGCV